MLCVCMQTVESLEAGAQEEYEEVEEGAAGGSSRYSSYSNRRPAKVWGLEETRLFYSAVRQCGTDFSMMQAFFPHRSRREVKHKFRRYSTHTYRCMHRAMC